MIGKVVRKKAINELYSYVEGNMEKKYTLKLKESENCPDTRNIKTSDFDFLFCDTFDYLGTDDDYIKKIAEMDREDYLKKYKEEMVDVLTYAKGLIKVANPKQKVSGQWLVGVDTNTVSSYGRDIFGVKETKRTLLFEKRDINMEDSHNFHNELNWFMWGVTGTNWNRINFDIKGTDRKALYRGREYSEADYDDVCREYKKDNNKRKRIEEPSFLGWFSYSTKENYQEKLAKQIIYRYTKIGDTILMVDIHKDNIFLKVALEEGRNVAILESGIDMEQELEKKKVYSYEKVESIREYKKSPKFREELSKEIGVEVDTIENIDAYDYLKKIKDKSLDAVITDVPYNLTSRYKGSKQPYLHGNYGVVFGDWDKDEFEIAHYLNEVASKIKDDGNLIVFNNFNSFEEMSQVLKYKGFTVKGTYTWVKPNPVPGNPKLWSLNSFEQFIWAVKDPTKYTLNLSADKYLVEEVGVNSGALIYSSHADLNNRFHSTQKPYKLMESIVKLFTNKGDVVLDSFMGSGTTAVACANTRRYYVGSELDKEYHEKSLERIKKEKRKPVGLLGKK